MRYSILVTIVFANFIFTGATVQPQARIPAGIAIAIKTGNSSELAKHMNSTIELLLLDKEDFYKKDVAENILRDFFTQYQVKDFTIRHQGAKNDAQYAIGNMNTTKGNFRVYLLLKKVDGELLIHILRIEPDNGK